MSNYSMYLELQLWVRHCKNVQRVHHCIDELVEI